MQATVDYKYLRLIQNRKFNLCDVKRCSTSSSLQLESIVKLSGILRTVPKFSSKSFGEIGNSSITLAELTYEISKSEFSNKNCQNCLISTF